MSRGKGNEKRADVGFSSRRFRRALRERRLEQGPDESQILPLFVQTADTIKADDNTLRFVDEGRQTLFYSHRPECIAVHFTMAAYKEEWTSRAGPDSFADDPPDAGGATALFTDRIRLIGGPESVITAQRSACGGPAGVSRYPARHRGRGRGGEVHHRPGHGGTRPWRSPPRHPPDKRWRRLIPDESKAADGGAEKERVSDHHDPGDEPRTPRDVHPDAYSTG